MRHWFQFRLRTAAVLAIVLALPLAWMTNAHRAALSDRAAVARLGSPDITWNPAGNRWLDAYQGRISFGWLR